MIVAVRMASPSRWVAVRMTSPSGWCSCQADDNIGLELGGNNDTEQKVKGMNLKDKTTSF